MTHLLLVLLVLCRTAGDLCLKAGVNHRKLSDFSHIMISPLFIAGVLLSILNFFVWALCLNYFDLSYAYPFVSISYLTIMIFGKILFNEYFDRHKIIGLGFIAIGTIFLFGGAL